MLENKIQEQDTLLYIIDLHNKTTLVGYTSYKVEVYDMSIQQYFRSQGAIKQKGYKAAMSWNNMQIYPTAGRLHPNCCWLHMDAVYQVGVENCCLLLHKYSIEITPTEIRLRKKYLDPKERYRKGR